jgi:hypothetical protein
MTTLKTIAVSTATFMQLQKLAIARGVSVVRVIEPVIRAGIEAAKGGAEIPIDRGKVSGASS